MSSFCASRQAVLGRCVNVAVDSMVYCITRSQRGAACGCVQPKCCQQSGSAYLIYYPSAEHLVVGIQEVGEHDKNEDLSNFGKTARVSDAYLPANCSTLRFCGSTLVQESNRRT